MAGGALAVRNMVDVVAEEEDDDDVEDVGDWSKCRRGETVGISMSSLGRGLRPDGESRSMHRE